MPLDLPDDKKLGAHTCLEKDCALLLAATRVTFLRVAYISKGSFPKIHDKAICMYTSVKC